MQVAICDDEPAHIQILGTYFDRHYGDIEWEPYDSGEALVAAYQHGQRYDALFIDMEMKQLNGLDTAAQIRHIDDKAILIFVTSHAHYAIDGYTCEPLRYLLKPVQEKKLREAVQAIRHKLGKKRPIIEITCYKERIRLYGDEILYGESRGNWISLHTQNDVYKTRLSIAQLMEKLPPGMFARVHKGFVVNLSHVRAIDGKELYLHHCATPVPLGRAYKKDFDEAMINFEKEMYGK